MTSRILTLLPVLLLAIVFLPGKSLAVGNLHAGRLKIQPYLVVSEKYTDNVFSTKSDRREDFIILYNPGIRLEFPYRRHKLTIDQNMLINTYKVYEDEETTDFSNVALAQFKFGGDVGLSLLNLYNKGHEPRGTSPTGALEKFRTTTSTASFVYNAEKAIMLQFDVTFSEWDYEQEFNEFRERETGIFSSYLYYRFLPKTSVFVEYDYEDTDYERKENNDLDNIARNIYFGLTWQLRKSSRGTAKAGYTLKSFKDDEDAESTIAVLDFSHEFSSSTGVTLSASKRLNETNLQGVHYLTTTGVSADISHKFLRRLTLVLRGTFGEDRYSDPVGTATVLRKDKTFTGGGGLRYELRSWLYMSLDYQMRSRNSNLPDVEYVENTGIFGISLQL